MRAELSEYDHAIAVVNRYRNGWQARRDGLGFLCWFRGRDGEWQGMTDGEAKAWLDADERDTAHWRAVVEANR